MTSQTPQKQTSEGTGSLAQPARFLVLDGVDGCGKSTQAERLVQRLTRELGVKVQHLREPGTTPVGESLRKLLLDSSVELQPEVEVLLFLAARRTLLHDRIEPALKRGEWVVCERFHGSTFAYQGIAGGLGGESTLALCREQTGPIEPDLEIILDLPLPEALQRRGLEGDRIENQGSKYQLKVAEGFREYLQVQKKAQRVSASGTPEEVAMRVWDLLGQENLVGR